MLEEDGETGSREGGGSKLWSVGRPRDGERCPGVDSLKTVSLEKWYLPAKSHTRYLILFSS